MLLHHGLDIAPTWCPTMLMRELLVLVRRAEVSLMWLRVWATHWRHGSGWHLEHLRSLSTCLHKHHGSLLMALLRALMAHHRRTWTRAVGVAAICRPPRHMAWILGIRWTRSRRIHLHLRIGRHAHIWSVRGLAGHHMSTHCGSWRVDILAWLCIAESYMLHVWTHAKLWHGHLLISRHWLRLCAIHVWWHWSR